MIITNDQEDILINILKNKLPNYSNKTIKQYIKYNKISVNNKIINEATYLVPINSQIKLIDKEENNIKLDIIYEDNDLIAINKPCKLLSIGNSKEKDNTAFHLVSNYVKKINKNNKIYVVHRLDEETSGILLFAKNPEIQKKLQENWNDLVKTREYYAIIPDKTKASGTIKSYLTMNHNQIVYSSKNNEGNLAITHYELVKYKEPYSLLKVNIDTGRRNQIRVHLSENYKPIVGDKKYGSKLNPINRLCLHASKLVLIDPRTNKLLTLETNIPKIMLNLFEN